MEERFFLEEETLHVSFAKPLQLGLDIPKIGLKGLDVRLKLPLL